MPGITLTIKNLQRAVPLRGPVLRTLARAARRVFFLKGRISKGEINICFVDNSRIRALNKRYLHKDSPTDVLAFNLTEKFSDSISADIAISAETAVANARVFHTSPAQELHRYVVHGALHILGYDDKTKKQKKIMERHTERILSDLKLLTKTS